MGVTIWLNRVLSFSIQMPIRISAIISDYDGTLSPTASVKSSNDQIPQDLQNVLWEISRKIPVCIISSKDFGFLRQKVQFARIVACILGIEIFHLFQSPEHRQNFLKSTTVSKSAQNGALGAPVSKYSISNIDRLLKNSIILNDLGNMVLSKFQGLKVEHRFTYVDKILAAISIDYRHLQKWEQYKTNIEPNLKKAVVKFIDSNAPNDLYIQTYSDHPFLDVYPFKFDKGAVLETIVQSLNQGNKGKVLYLGDSENDNPAFHYADLSIGIQSDARIRTKLDSDYIIEFNELRPFLQRLNSEDFVFNRMSQNVL
jgi:HAD superfamily hydrolase (TIGR01484 family)